MKIVAVVFLSSILFACNSGNKETYADVANNSNLLAIEVDQEHPGKKLMENNCNICHNPKTAENAMIAPPMIAVKMHYINENTSKQEFIDAMVAWSKSPSIEKTKMPGAVKKFGLMPYQFHPEATIISIADYMFDYEIEEPIWFEEHYKNTHSDRPKMKGKKGKGEGMGQNNNSNTSAQERGMQIAQTTKAELGKNLMGQIQKSGVIAALDFCNIEAMPITDSMATFHKAIIKRVTDKTRNPNNQANKAELKHIENFKKQVVSGKEIAPIVVKSANKTEFYYPIVTNSMCLKCHGTPEKELETLTLSKINELYPNDKAIGYSENEVRGIWSINFEN